ncbi:MAG: hypothetical protein OER88_05525, partial [Planctomycetota bacterium]|nr:hypothetical protein [Planctomycetota bacterium]
MTRSILVTLCLAGAVLAQDKPWAEQVAETKAAHEKDKEALAALEEPAAQVDLALVRLAAERRRLDERLDARFAVSERAGDLLMAALRRFRKMRGRLDSRTLPQLDRDLSRVQAERVRLQDRIWELELPLDGSEPPPQGTTVREYASAMRPVLQALRERVTTLEKTEVALTNLEAKVRQQRQALTELIALVTSKGYWLRTDPPLGGEVASRAAEEARQLYRAVRAARWSDLRPARVAALLGLVVVMLLLHLRVRRLRTRWKYRGGPMWQGAQRTAMAVLFAAAAPLALVGAAALVAAYEPAAVFCL